MQETSSISYVSMFRYFRWRKEAAKFRKMATSTSDHVCWIGCIMHVNIQRSTDIRLTWIDRRSFCLHAHHISHPNQTNMRLTCRIGRSVILEVIQIIKSDKYVPDVYIVWNTWRRAHIGIGGHFASAEHHANGHMHLAALSACASKGPIHHEQI